MHDAVRIAQELVRLDTRGGQEKQAAELVASLLADAGFAVDVDEPVAGRANVIARSGDDTPVTLTGHLDTVPAEASGWSFDPLSGRVENGLLLGRGSSDMKAGVACIATAAVRHATSRPGGAGVQLVLTLGEETGCEGARWIDPATLTPTRLLLVAEPTANQVVLGHKGALWLRLTARGRAAHGSRPDLGENALATLAAAAVRIHEYGGWPVSDTHGAATANVGAFHAGAQPNLVPDHAEMLVDVRTVPGFSSDDAITAITGLCGPAIEVERTLDLPGVATHPGSVTVRRVMRALQAEAGQRPGYATYFTDASILRDKLAGPAVVIYGPGDPQQAHTVDETCPVAGIDQATEALYGLLGDA